MGEAVGNWITNQVVWCKWTNGEWFPALVIDPNDKWAELEQAKDDHQHVLWLGDGRISLVLEADMRDFCLAFRTTFPMMNPAEKYKKAVAIAVRLAAARADEEIPGDDWAQWGIDNMHKFMELSVSKSFYKALQRRDDPAEDGAARRLIASSDPKRTKKFKAARKEAKEKRQEESRRNSDSSCSGIQDLVDAAPSAAKDDDGEAAAIVGRLVWAKVADDDATSPGIVLGQDDETATVELVAESNTVTVPIKDVFEFGAGFNEHYRPGVAIPVGTDQPAFVSAVQLCCQYFAAVNGHVIKRDDGISFAMDNSAVFQKNTLTEKQLERLRKGRDPKVSTLDAVSKSLGVSTPSQPPAKKRGRPPKSAAGNTPGPSSSKKAHVDGATPAKKAATTPKGTPSKRGPRVSLAAIDMDALNVPLDMGWTREISMRKAPSNKLGDVYYRPPIGKKLRSMVEVRRFLDQGSITDLTEQNFCFRETVETGHAKEEKHGVA